MAILVGLCGWVLLKIPNSNPKYGLKHRYRNKTVGLGVGNYPYYLRLFSAQPWRLYSARCCCIRPESYHSLHFALTVALQYLHSLRYSLLRSQGFFLLSLNVPASWTSRRQHGERQGQTSKRAMAKARSHPPLGRPAYIDDRPGHTLRLGDGGSQCLHCV